MNFAPFLSIALVMLVGFAAHRASLCTVKAVAEIMTKGAASMLASFAKAAAWTAALSGTILFFTTASGMPVWVRTPHAYALAGGFVFGIGAAVNGGCSFSTLQRLADGDLSMLGTLSGFVVGILGWVFLDQSLGLTVLQTRPSFWQVEHVWRLPLLIILWLWVLQESIRLWGSQTAKAKLHRRLARHTYRPSSAAALLGIAGGLLFTLQGAWTYTNYLRAEVSSWLGATSPPTPFHGVLLGALFLGMLFSSLQRHSFALKLDWGPRLGRHVAGGILMGVGGALVPGGNDTLILVAIPSLSLWAIGVYLALLAGVALTLMTMHMPNGSFDRVECRGDGCE
jgi:uncharacterized membrane protein YedE/YeeE